MLLDAVEAGQVAVQEGLQALPAASDSGSGNVGVGEQGLGGRVFEQGHPCHSEKWSSNRRPQAVSIPPKEKRLQSK